MEAPNVPWRLTEDTDLSISGVKSLISGAAGCIVIDDFFSADLCAAFVGRIHKAGFNKTFCGKTFPAKSSGVSILDYKDLPESQYLDDVALGNLERQKLLAGDRDLTDRVFDVLSRAWPAGARLAGRTEQPYFGAVIRELGQAHIHSDWLPRDLPDWSISAVSAQLSWHVYLTTPDSGGDFHVWQRSWEVQDEDAYRDFSEERKYDAGFLSDIAKLTISPKTGRFVIFNTRNYHAFDPVGVKNACIVASAFLGIKDEGQPIISW